MGMSSPLHVLPEWAPELAKRRFSFSPAIEGTTHNEWTLHRVSLNEAIVRNAVTDEELSIASRFIGDITRLEEAVRVVGLLRKLEYSEGFVRPLHRGVIAMPVPADTPRVRSAQPADIIPIREEPQPAPRWKHYLRIAVALGCLACIVAVYVFREGRTSRVRRFPGRPSRLVPHSPELIPQVQQQKR